MLVLKVLILGRESTRHVECERVVRDGKEPVAFKALGVQALDVHERVFAKNRIELREEHEVAPGPGVRAREPADDSGK